MSRVFEDVRRFLEKASFRLHVALGATDKAIELVRELPFTGRMTLVQWELKLLVLIAIFVHAFFKFTWSLRQYGFASVVIGMAPGDGSRERVNPDSFAEESAQVISRAALAFNLGLRSYYFGLAFHLAIYFNPRNQIRAHSPTFFHRDLKRFRNFKIRDIILVMK